MEDNYLDDVEKVKKQVAKHWKPKYRKKKNDYNSDSSSDSSDSSSSDSSSEDERKHRRKRKKKKRDLYALNVDDAKKDTCNQYGMIQCGHCKKHGHGIANCWELHGRPANFNSNRRNGNGNGNGYTRSPKRCWLCGSEEHIARDCPTNPNNTDNNSEDDAQINNLFIGAMWHYKRKVKERVKARLNAYNVIRNKNKESCIIIMDGKEYQSFHETTRYNVNSHNDLKSVENTNESIGSLDSGSWCKICKSSEEEDNVTHNEEIPRRMIEAEHELKQILGIIKNNYDNEVDSDNKSTQTELESSNEYVFSNSRYEKKVKSKGVHSKKIKPESTKKAKDEESQFYIMTVSCDDADSSKEEEENKECSTNKTIESHQNSDGVQQESQNDQDPRMPMIPIITTSSITYESNNQGVGHATRNRSDTTHQDVRVNNPKGEKEENAITKQHKNNIDSTINKLDHKDFYYNRDGTKMVQKIATNQEATDLINKYYGDMEEKMQKSKMYEEWKEVQLSKGTQFTPHPWENNYDNYEDDTNDSVEMNKRMKKRELYSKDPLQQLSHRYVSVNENDNNDCEDIPKRKQKKDDEEAVVKQNNEASKEKEDQYIGPTYFRDPYETDTDQEIDDGSSDLDEHGNIIQGEMRRLIPEEFNQWFNANVQEEEENSTHQEVAMDEEENGEELSEEENTNDCKCESKEDHDSVNVVMTREGDNIKNEETIWETWLADTGASCHVSYSDEGLINGVMGCNDRVVVGDGRKCKVTQKGDLNLMNHENHDCITLTGVRIVKEMGKNIMSIGRLLKEGEKLMGSGNQMKVTLNHVTFFFHKNENDGLFYIKLRRMRPKVINHCHRITNYTGNDNGGEWKKVEHKKYWPKMSRDEAHAKWRHPHLEQMNKMGNYYKVNLTGHLSVCVGCGVVKSRTMATTRTCSKLASRNGERLIFDTTGPYPKSRGGMKYWMCAVDDKSDKTWTCYTPTKKHMVKFVEEIVTLINGLDLKVKYLRCDNTGEHQQNLQDYCAKAGITLEYTAPRTPKQNGRVEKKIHGIWSRV